MNDDPHDGVDVRGECSVVVSHHMRGDDMSTSTLSFFFFLEPSIVNSVFLHDVFCNLFISFLVPYMFYLKPSYKDIAR